MEEDEYKLTYDELASVRCVFEKALTNNRAKCSLSKHFWLADREGYACKNIDSSTKCCEILKKLRENSIFVLKLHDIKGSLPHNMEIRVQVGGMTGLVKVVEAAEMARSNEYVADDISGVINKAVKKFGALDNLPYSEIIKSVVLFQGRRRRQR